MKIRRNDPCLCGSGKKYKKCCLARQPQGRANQALVTDQEKEALSDTLFEAALAKTLVKMSSDRRDKFVQAIANDRTSHENQHLAYHEGGHALLEMLFYRDLKKVTISPFFDVKTQCLLNGASFDISPEARTLIVRGPDYDGNDARVHAYLTVQEITIFLGGSIAEKLFCTCGWNPDGDGYDRDGLQQYYEEVESGFFRGISPCVFAVVSHYRPQLDAIAKALFERKTLTGVEVRDVMVASGYPDDFNSDQFSLDTIEALIPAESLGLSSEAA